MVKICADGMKAEFDGRIAEARDLFDQAWAAAKDDFEACVAAHYVARHQETPESRLRWNQIALDRALAVGDERVTAFFPSLYLNLGWSWEALGDRDEARKDYQIAAQRMDDLPADPYGDLVRQGIAEGLRRVNQFEC